MLGRVISGGQTGADQAGWRAARAAGLVTGGLMPHGFLTEDGPRPEFARLFGAAEHDEADPAARTVANVHAADATLVFAARPCGAGTRLTIETCREAGLRHVVVAWGPAGLDATAAEVADWLVSNRVGTLNVAGERESVAPGIGRRVETLLADVFARLTG